MKWDSPEFRRLQRAWYKRLAEEGFKDHERFIAGDMLLMDESNGWTKHVMVTDELGALSKQEYYRLMSEKAHQADYISEVDRLILTRHAEGLRIKAICEELAKIGERRCRNTVTFTIRRYAVKWEVRKFSRKQLNMKPRKTA